MQRNSTIGELMERKRIQDGAKEYQGHTYMDLARFDDATKPMIIFDVLTDESPVGWKGERNRLYLSDVGGTRRWAYSSWYPEGRSAAPDCLPSAT